MAWEDLSEHTGTLVALLGVSAGIAGFFFWKLIKSMVWWCNCQQHYGNGN